MTDVATVAEKKQTVLGLYVTAKEAYDRWKADPENVKIVDVRTPEELLFVGHPRPSDDEHRGRRSVLTGFHEVEPRLFVRQHQCGWGTRSDERYAFES